MRTYLILSATIALGLACGACKEKKKSGKGGPDKSIEALKKDGAKLKEDTDALLKQRGNLSKDRDEIKAARKALEEKRAKLAKDDIAGHAKLAKEELALREKEKKLQSQESKVNDKLLGALKRQEQFYARASAALASRSGGGDPTSNVRSREHQTALREKSIARREAAVAKREKAVNELYKKVNEYRAKKCATAAPVFTTVAAPSFKGGGSRTYTKKDAKSALGRAMGVMSAKGIRYSDLPSGFAKLIKDIKGYIRKKEYARAKYAADQLYATLKSIKIDRAFVGAKMGRLASRIRRKKLSASKREKVNKLFVKVTGAYNDGRFSSANRLINKILGIIR